MNVTLTRYLNLFFYSLRKKITEVFHQAFFDILQEQISKDPPDYTQAMVLLKEIKEVTENKKCLLKIILGTCNIMKYFAFSYIIIINTVFIPCEINQLIEP